MLPELTERLSNSARRAFAGFGSKTLSLGLKSAEFGNDWYQRNGFYGLAAARGASGGPAWSGENVTLQTALNHSVVYTCKRILAEPLGMLPLPMMRMKDGEKEPATTHPMYSALQNAPNDEMTAQQMRETMSGHSVMSGDSFAQIFRRSGTEVAYELQMLLPSQVNPDREKSGQRRLVYLVKDGNSAEKTYTVQRGKAQDILHVPGIGWDGVHGYSVLTMARQSFGTALAGERHVGRFYARGGRMPYNLKLNQANVFEDDEAFKKFRDEWEHVYSDPNKAPIIETWLDYAQTGVSLKDSQMLESRQFSVSEICRWFRVSPHMAGDLSRATHSNIEQLALEFVTFTLQPWLKRWEQQLWRCVLTPEEKGQGYYWKHNVNALLRADFAARMAGYATALQNGYMSQNEVRDLEDWNGFEGGDDYWNQLNMAPLSSTPTAAVATRVRLGTGKKNWRAA